MTDSFSFSTPCPNCGGTLVFQSTASVMGVCSYCQTTVSRNAEVIEQHGKISQILTDFSPLQIGSTGVYHDVPFSVVGRLQMRFDAGEWFEWHIAFADGRIGWLAESDGTYSITEKVDDLTNAPRYDDIALNRVIRYQQLDYVVSDINQPVCIAGEGELPFMVFDEATLQVCDARYGQKLISLDYGTVNDSSNSSQANSNQSASNQANSHQPSVYAGENISLDDLKMQFLRETHDIVASAGNISQQQNTSTECPNCGDSLDFVSGMAEHVVCRSCFSQVKVSDDKAELIEKHESLNTYPMTLNIGDTANIDGQTYTIIGAIGYAEIEDGFESSTWIDYLLYNAHNKTAAFLWLTETKDSEGWSTSYTLLEQPQQDFNSVTYDGKSWQKQWTYHAKVTWALGAFYWQVKINNLSTYDDYTSGNLKLIKETSPHDIIWNKSKNVSTQDIATWFGLENEPHDFAQEEQADKRLWHIMLVSLWILNLPTIIFGHGSFVLTIFASVAIYILFIFANQGDE